MGATAILGGPAVWPFSAVDSVHADGCSFPDDPLSDLALRRRHESMGHKRAALSARRRRSPSARWQAWRSRSLQLAAMVRLAAGWETRGLAARDRRDWRGHGRVEETLFWH